jgi:hypothetical protein
MSSPEKAEPEPSAADPDAMAKALELELIMKRASWQKIRARHGTWRALSLLFLFFVILCALVAYFYFSTQIGHRGRDSSSTERVESDR